MSVSYWATGIFTPRPAMVEGIAAFPGIFPDRSATAPCTVLTLELARTFFSTRRCHGLREGTHARCVKTIARPMALAGDILTAATPN
jgi:hypothetical protein